MHGRRGACCASRRPTSRRASATAGRPGAHALVLPRFARVWGGGGDDLIALDSHAGNTRAYGGPGDDDLTAGGEGGQLVDGGGGDDRLHVGGFAGSSSGFGGPGDDRMSYFIALPQTGLGVLEGGGGEDEITLEAPGGGASAPATAAPTGSRCSPTATFSRYVLAGGDGPDIADRRPGRRTRSTAAAGATAIETHGGDVDVVTCGDGVDSVRADADRHRSPPTASG